MIFGTSRCENRNDFIQIGRNAIAFTTTVDTICFIDIDNNAIHHYRVSDQIVDGVRCDGLSCMAGHRNESILAISEMTCNRRIILLAYPRLQCITTLSIHGGNDERETTSPYYRCIQFSETEHVVALTSFPDYVLEVWNWRTATLLLVQPTRVKHFNQIIRLTFPLTVAQIVVGHSAWMHFWEIHFSVDYAAAIETKIELPFENTDETMELRLTYDLDGSLYMTNGSSQIWHVLPISKKIIDISERLMCDDKMDSSGCTKIESYKDGIIVAGSAHGIKYFVKAADNEWHLRVTSHDERIVEMVCVEQKYVFAMMVDGTVKRLAENDSFQFNEIGFCNRKAKQMIELHPFANHLAVTTNLDEILIVCTKSGEMSLRIMMNGIESIASHPQKPLIAIGTNDGFVSILEFNSIDQPTILIEHHVCHDAIRNVNFSGRDHDIIAMDKNGGIYLIASEIKKSIEWSHSSIDVTIKLISGKCHLLSLMGSAESEFLDGEFDRMAGEEVLYIAFNLDAPHEHDDLSQIKLNQFYSSFRWLGTSTDADELIGVKYLSKSFDILKMCIDDDNEIDFVVQKIVETGHALNSIRIIVDAERLLTYGIDGRVFVWDVNTMDVLFSLTTHGKHSGGVKQAIYTRNSEVLQSIGYNGNFVVYASNDSDHKSWQISFHDILNRCIHETRLCAGNRLALSTRSWKSIEMQKSSAAEIEKSITELAYVASELSRIRANVELLLNANDNTESNDEKLPTKVFNVNKSGTDRLFEKIAKERDAHKQKRVEFERYQQEMLAYIKRCTWDRLRVKPTKIRSIGACEAFIENYTMTELDEKLGNDSNIEQILQMPEAIAAINAYRPWIPKTYDRNKLELPTLRANAMKSKNFERFTNVASKIIERNLKARATSSHLFITPIATETNEIDIEDSQQLFEHNVRAYHNIIKLREYFNGIFVRIQKTKEIEMDSIRRRIVRLRQIDSDLALLATDADELPTEYTELTNLEYTVDERPDDIFESSDNGLASDGNWNESKIGDTAQGFIDENFLQEKLDEMMNGTLEISWEEELKKDPVKPSCLLRSLTEVDYTDKDRAEIAAYKAKMEQLCVARAAYVQRLIAERKNLHSALEVQTRQFNDCLSNALLSKIRTEFAIRSEELKLLMPSVDHSRYRQIVENGNCFSCQRQDIRKEIAELSKVYAMLEANLNNLKAKFDELTTKDQSLDKQFRTTFAELVSAGVIDQIYRIFKRRPKGRMTTCQSATILSEMADRIASTSSNADSGALLPDDAVQYLQLINVADKVNNAPNFIDSNAWQILCKMRRSKIENEFRLRGCGAQIADTETSQIAFGKRIASKKSKLIQCDGKIDALKEEKAKSLIELRKTQIYTKRGNVELPLTGHMSDFDNAILLDKMTLIKTNTLIQEAGMKKLNIMQMVACYRRRVQYYQWKFETLKMKIEDMNAYIRTIEKCVVTKEIQLWLRQKQDGRIEDTSRQTERIKSNQQQANTENSLLKKISHVEAAIGREQRKNDALDRKIANLKVQIDNENFNNDFLIHEEDIIRRNERMAAIIMRTQLVRRVQMQHSQILERAAILELQQLRTFPTLNIAPNHFQI